MENNLQNYIDVFCECFDVNKEEAKNLKYQDIDSWDSVGHMGLVAALEDMFHIEFEADDIIDLSSFAKGIEILEKYNIKMS
ncbi:MULTISPECIES: acyl carrier protein [Helicobacter]|uniref:Acyl carrier protein n=1 Tax=Helicobacter ibis TaxID=2962633 RepID=A0ABT4VDV8_9HELI|nr:MULTISPECIES: acyl carrier protein [Helicobacter]MDA3966499.1 acyl carrier protein [Helicobacter sp. WB40]MDA3968885.1 acyl carrier protein [Helicobacter ibis]